MKNRKRLLSLLVPLFMVLAVLADPWSARADTPTVVSLTFDDGNADQYAVRSMLSAHGMKGTFFINSGRVGLSGFMTTQQLADIASDGNEIGGHTVTHADLPTLDPDESKRQICNDRVNLINMGFSPTSFAYPYGDTNTAVKQQVADCGYNSARGTSGIETPPNNSCNGCPNAETIPPQDAYNTRAPSSVRSNWTLQDVQNLVTAAEQHGGGWVQLIFHHICDGCAPDYTFSPSNLSLLLDWLQARAGQGTVVKAVGEVIGGTFKPGVPGPVPPAGQGLQNASLETDAGGDGVPDCWSLGGFGTNTATFTRTTDAHTGSFAERIDVTSYTSGDRKLVVSQDLGACSPAVTAGHRQQLDTWYKSSVPTQFVVYYRDGTGHWVYWTSSPQFAAQAAYTHATWTTPALPSNAAGLSFGLNITSVGSLTTDDYGLTDAGTAPAPVTTALGDNPSLEIASNGSLPDCYQFGSSGTNTATWTRTSDAHTGSFAERVDVSAYTSGDRKLVTKQDTGTCSPTVTPGHTYTVGTWYKSTATARFVVYYRNSSGQWTYWATGPTAAASSTWTQATWTTAAVPAGAVALSFGLSIGQVGALTTDDYTLVDPAIGSQPPPSAPTGGD
jgi:peptidoglycan/xylan/chitin deacetylase (PgdA/CDA1 family)